MTLAEYLPFSFWICSFTYFLKSFSCTSCRLCVVMELSCLVLLKFDGRESGPDLVPTFCLSLCRHCLYPLPDVSVLGIPDRLKDTGWGTKWSYWWHCNLGLTIGLLKATLCPWPLPAMGIFGTWGRWKTSYSLIFLPLFSFLLWDAVPCCMFTVPWMTLNTSSLNRAAQSFSNCSHLNLEWSLVYWDQGLLRQIAGDNRCYFSPWGGLGAFLLHNFLPQRPQPQRWVE